MPFPSPRFDREEVGKRIRQARKDRGFPSAQKFAAKLGIGWSAYYKKEQGRSPFDLDELNRICDLLDAPSLFPFVDWEKGRTLDEILDRVPHRNDKPKR